MHSLWKFPDTYSYERQGQDGLEACSKLGSHIVPHYQKFQSISQEFLENESQNCDPTKISNLGDQFWGISREFPRNQLQEMILEKFLGNSSKKVTTELLNLGKFLTFVTHGPYRDASTFITNPGFPE